MSTKKDKDVREEKDVQEPATVIVDEDVITEDDAPASDVVVADDATQETAALRKRNTAYLAMIILLAGIAAGSFFVDVAQLFSGKGFSARALKDVQVVEYDGYTWARFDDPKVVVEVFDADDCETCVTDEVVTQMRTVVPTMEVHRVDVNTEDGKKYAAQQGVKYIPAFLFSRAVKEADFYQQAQMLFAPTADGKYTFDTAAIGMPVGKYLTTPSAVGIVTGGDDAQVHIVVFADYTAPDIQKLTDDLAALHDAYGDKVQIAVKALVNPQQPQAQKIAEAVTCAHAQQGYAAFLASYGARRAQLMASTDIDADLVALAQTAKLDSAQFDSCRKEAKTAEQLIANTEEARAFAVRAIPAAFVNGEVVQEAVTHDTLKAKIDTQLQPVALQADVQNAAPEEAPQQ